MKHIFSGRTDLKNLLDELHRITQPLVSFTILQMDGEEHAIIVDGDTGGAGESHTIARGLYVQASTVVEFESIPDGSMN